MTELVRSVNLRLNPSARGGHIAYHTLFGNVRLLSASAVNLLDQFTSPRSPSDVAALGSWGADREQTLANIDRLRQLHYLIPPGSGEERELVAQWLRRRESMISSGYFIGEVELSISDLCNFKCSYCFADIADELSDDRRRLHMSRQRLMPFEVARRIIDRVTRICAEAGRDRIIVKFIGREPLINASVMLEILTHFGHEVNGVRIDYSVTTNCSLLTEELSEHLARHQVTCNVSVDLIGNDNDLTRVTQEGGGTFAMVDAAIRLLRSHGNTVIINSIFTKDNFPRLDESLLDYATKHGVALVNVVPVLAVDEIAAHTCYSNDVICDRLERLYRYSRVVGIPLRSYWLNGVTKLLASRDRAFLDRIDDRASCVASGNQLNFEPGGDIFTCRMSGAWIGHIDDIESALSGPTYRHYIMRTFTDACHGCNIEGFCHGLCVGHLEKKFNDIYRTDNGYCDMYQEMSRRVLSLI